MAFVRTFWLGCVALVVAGLSALALERTPAPPAPPDVGAISAYRAGDLAAARAEWTTLLDAEPRLAGPERARILANLGNVAFREGKVLESVGWFTSSIRLRPRDADTWANLEHARRVAKLEPADRGDLGATVQRVLGAFTPSESRLLALVGLIGLGAGLAYEALRGGRTGRWLALGGSAFALLTAAPWIHDVSTRSDSPGLVVEEGQALVRSEPRTDAAVLAEAAAGDDVDMLDSLPGWTKVRISDGNEGWVETGEVFALER